jgi:hypothetical protein
MDCEHYSTIFPTTCTCKVTKQAFSYSIRACKEHEEGKDKEAADSKEGNEVPITLGAQYDCGNEERDVGMWVRPWEQEPII